MNKDEPCAETEMPTSSESLRQRVALYEARLAEIADMAAHVRHEINNPLTGLLGQAQLLLREDLSDSSRRRVQIIEQLATRIRDVVAELRVIQQPHALSSMNDDTDERAGEPPRH